ncbi:MAG TPA: hypothetical protein VNJ07_01960, partial [Chitinophagales bacterium]|nr:hypothetical protein [Chitinophagales bacterium]
MKRISQNFIIALMAIQPLVCFSQTLIKYNFGLNTVLGGAAPQKFDEFKLIRAYTSAGSFCREPE